MSCSTPSLRAAASLLGAGLLLSACRGGNEDVIRQQSELRSKLELQAAEAEALRSRIGELESRSRSLEEQVAALGVRPAPVPASGAGPAARAGEAEESAAPASSGGEVASLLESEAGREKLREFLKEEEARREEVARKANEERLEGFIKDRVTGYLTEQLNLTADQQARVIDITTEAGRRYSELWKDFRPGAGAGGNPTDMQAIRDKSEEIRKETMDKLSQALTVDQYNKLEELGPGAGILGGRGFGGSGGPSPPRGIQGGGRGGR